MTFETEVRDYIELTKFDPSDEIVRQARRVATRVDQLIYTITSTLPFIEIDGQRTVLVETLMAFRDFLSGVETGPDFDFTLASQVGAILSASATARSRTSDFVTGLSGSVETSFSPPVHLNPTFSHMVGWAVRLLPLRTRRRYREEYMSELYALIELGTTRRQQILYTMRIIFQAFSLRRALREDLGKDPTMTRRQYPPGGIVGYVLDDDDRTRRALSLLWPVALIVFALAMTFSVLPVAGGAVAILTGVISGIRRWLRRRAS